MTAPPGSRIGHLRRTRRDAFPALVPRRRHENCARRRNDAILPPFFGLIAGSSGRSQSPVATPSLPRTLSKRRTAVRRSLPPRLTMLYHGMGFWIFGTLQTEGRSTMRRRFIAIAVLGALFIIGPHTTPAGADFVPARGPVAGDAGADFVPGYRTQVEDVDAGRIGVRFRPATQARIRSGRLVSLSGRDLSAVDAIAARIPGAAWEPRFPLPEEELARLTARGEARTLGALPDLNLFALLVLPPAESAAAAQARLQTVLHDLNAAEPVAEAWALPIPELARVEVLRAVPDGPAADSQSSTDRTPDFSDMQGYLYDPPVGVAADSAWTFPGGKGEGVRMVDIEFGWLFTHEDLKDPWFYGGDPAVSDHGTAVLGEIAGQHNGYGVQGISPEVEIGGYRVGDLAAAILDLATVLAPGDIYLIEIQISGPGDGSWVPMEWVPDVFAAIQTTSALGIICVEAGANGSVDLDDALYGGLFDRRVRDSGAILVGAGTPSGLNAEGFSNYGSRMDLQGWGSSIVTTGYGDLQGGAPEEHYTAGFNGTSGASPIVVGSVASLQGQALDLFGTPLTPALAQEILSVTGSPWTGDRQIGERPNLAAARTRLLLGYGGVVATVRDAQTLEPLPGMYVEVPETGRLARTGPEGQTFLQLTAEEITLRVTGDFFYQDQDFPFTVSPGETLAVNLDVSLAPMGTLAGTMTDPQGDPIEGVRITVPETPLDTVWTAGDGSFAVPDIPANSGYQAVAGMRPGYGAAYASFDIAGGDTTSWSPSLAAAEMFESGPAGYTATGEYELGYPSPPSPPPFSGENVWGNALEGYYDDMTISTLTSPVFDFTGATELTLSFHHWYWIEHDDGAQIQVWDEAEQEWVYVEPVGGYPDDSITILYYEPGYNGQIEDWEPVIVPLDEYAGGPFQFRFYFRSDYSGHKAGWYLDDIALATDLDPSGAGERDLTADALRLQGAEPNPAHGPSRIRFELGRPQAVRLQIYDVTGGLVRSLERPRLPAGLHTIIWDGNDTAGRTAASGLYFYRLRAGSSSAGGRVLRLR
ncbi:MAG: S8 family serine peptidase [Candidatus Eisenbacteria bacterium]|nr:S8 family serine peptidase [Candidatus Eisenbacteria bacterium]